jgi:3-dehydroquinate synthase class II
VWIETRNVQVLVAALESGLTTTALFSGSNVSFAEDWRVVGRFETVRLDERTGVVFSSNSTSSDPNEKTREIAIGIVCPVHASTDVHAISRLAGVEPLVLIDCGVRDEDEDHVADEKNEKNATWKIIPAENLIAAFRESKGESKLFAFCDSCDDARSMFEALAVGVDGVVLRTENPNEARRLAEYVSEDESSAAETRRAAANSNLKYERGVLDSPTHASRAPGVREPSRRALELTPATITKVTTLSTGDRVCVDCTSNFQPGEGLLVGSFARGLFLVHSECLDSFGYVSQRPFRVNAGPVCSYVLLPDGRTGYLSELRAGDEVLCVASDGGFEKKTVGRIKLEKRQMVLVEAVIVDGDCEEDDHETDDDRLCVDTGDDGGLRRATTYACLLQNAETVRLVSDKASGAAVSVSVLKVGDTVLVHRLAGARHTGIEISDEGWDER